MIHLKAQNVTRQIINDGQSFIIWNMELNFSFIEQNLISELKIHILNIMPFAKGRKRTKKPIPGINMASKVYRYYQILSLILWSLLFKSTFFYPSVISFLEQNMYFMFNLPFNSLIKSCTSTRSKFWIFIGDHINIFILVRKIW